MKTPDSLLLSAKDMQSIRVWFGICKKCSRLKLRAEEEIKVLVNLNIYAPGIVGTALCDSHREHVCRLNRIRELERNLRALMWRTDVN